MKKIILHIGTEKTATKSLQRFFCLNRLGLSKNGIWYPCSDRLTYCHGNAHFPLPASLFRDCPDFVPREKHDTPEPLFSNLVRDFKLRDEETALLSAEHFSSRCSRREEVRKIRQHLDRFDVRIVVYVRPQHELLVSAYSTYLKNGGKESLQAVVGEKCLTAGVNYFDYVLMMAEWCAVFGKDNISVRVFQKGRMKNENIFDDILSFLDITPAPSFEVPQQLNKAVSKETAEFLYFSNQHFPTFDDGNLSGWKQGQKFRSEVLSVIPDGTSLHELLSGDLKEEITEFYAGSNRALALQYRPDLNGRLFVDEDQDIRTDGYRDAFYSHDFVKWVVDNWKAAQPEP